MNEKCTRDGLTIFKRYPGPDAVYYHKLKHAGKQHMLSLSPLADDSFKLARQLRAQIKAGRLEVVGQIVDALKQRHPTTPLGQVLTRYETHAQAKVDIAPSTIAHNVNAVRNIFRVVQNLPPGDPARYTDAQIDAFPSTDFSPALLDRYKNQMLKTAGAAKLAEERARITANSTIRQARSLFSKKLPDDFYKDLILPPIAELRAVKTLKETRAGFAMPDPALMQKIAAALPALKLADPNAWIIGRLCHGAGLRPGELKHGRQHWFEEHVHGKTTRMMLRVQVEDDFRPKGKKERLIPISDDLHLEIQEVILPTLPGQPDYILRGSKTERTDQSFRRFATWLTNMGWTRKKKAHEFRKIFGSHVATQAGMKAAKEMLGHSQIATTERYYVGQTEVPTYTIPALG